MQGIVSGYWMECCEVKTEVRQPVGLVRQEMIIGPVMALIILLIGCFSLFCGFR